MIESFRGEEAMQLAGRILPAINSSGAGKKAVGEAVKLLEDRHGPEQFLESFLRQQRPGPGRKCVKEIQGATIPTRLALEMALHEEAEEIANIADGMLVAPAVERQLDAMKAGAPRDP